MIKNQINVLIALQYHRSKKYISYQVPAATYFGTKVPSSGSFSATKVHRSNKYFRHYSHKQRRIVTQILVGPALKYYAVLEDTLGQLEPTTTPIPFTPNWGQGNAAAARGGSITSPH
jgi:hypothetical protein